MKNTINFETCSKCGECADVCPSDIILKSDDGNYFFPEELEYLCVKCCQCMAVCPTNSVKVNGFEYGKDVIDLQHDIPDYQHFVNLLATRRSVRNFKDKEVPDELIQKIIDSLAFMPFGFESGVIQITVVNDRKKLRESLPLFSAFYDKMVDWMANPISHFFMKRAMHPAMYATVKDHLLPIIKSGHYKFESGDDNILRNAPCMLIFHSRLNAPEHLEDCWIATTIAMFSAITLGLGTTIIGLVPPALNKGKGIKEVFAIPEENEVISALILGYPKYKMKKTVNRPKNNITWLK